MMEMIRKGKEGEMQSKKRKAIDSSFLLLQELQHIYPPLPIAFL